MLEWKNPPPKEGGPNGSVMYRFVEELKTRPGEWAVYRKARNVTAANSSATAIKRGYPGVEATCRQCVIYARWVGEGEEK